MKSLLTGAIALFVFGIGQPSIAEAQTNDSILSDTHIVSQRYVEAEVIRVRSSDRTITVKGETRGQTRQFTVPEGARISVDGENARLRDLRRGDKIRLSFVRRDSNVVVDQIRMPQSSVSLAQRRAEAPPVVAEAKPSVLPSTASPLPAVLLVGLVLLASAALVRRIRA